MSINKVAIINSVAEKSTGKISYGLAKYLKKSGIDTIFCYGYGKRLNDPDTYRIDNKYERYIHVFFARLTGYQGAYSTCATKRLIKYLDSKQINAIYGVGLHGYYLNEKMFWDYVADRKIKFIYIMTEEYPFYGKCGYANDCTNYLYGCGNCKYLKEYPKSWFADRTAEMFEMKRNAYKNICEHAIFVGPEYTIKIGKKSPILNNIRTIIIDEAIDTNFYSPRDTRKLKLELKLDDSKVVILCIAPSNQGKKGAKYFTELARRFNDNEKYVFIHVGYMGTHVGLPSNYIPIGYVADQELLAQYYSLGDLFVFPSLLDTMPNTCLEALSCGLPLLCFNTSGMPYLGDESVLTLVEPKDVDALVEVVKHTEKRTDDLTRRCRQYAVNRYNSEVYYEKLKELLTIS